MLLEENNGYWTRTLYQYMSTEEEHIGHLVTDCPILSQERNRMIKSLQKTLKIKKKNRGTDAPSPLTFSMATQ